MLLALSLIMAKQAKPTAPHVVEEIKFRITDDVLNGLTEFIQSAQRLTPTQGL